MIHCEQSCKSFGSFVGTTGGVTASANIRVTESGNVSDNICLSTVYILLLL